MLAIFMTIENDGERRLAEELYLSYRGRMYGIAYSVLHNREDAEDAVMDAVYNIVNNISRFASLPRNKTESLIVIIVRNAAINRYNRNRRRGVLPLDEEYENIPDSVRLPRRCSAKPRIMRRCLPEYARLSRYTAMYCF